MRKPPLIRTLLGGLSLSLLSCATAPPSDPTRTATSAGSGPVASAEGEEATPRPNDEGGSGAEAGMDSSVGLQTGESAGDGGDSGTSTPSPAEPRADVLLVFMSECCGVNREAVDALEALLARYEKDWGRAIDGRRVRWGREGEFTQCLFFGPASGEQARALVAAIKDKVGRKRLVSVHLDEACPPESDPMERLR